jgi:hypothetical protein
MSHRTRSSFPAKKISILDNHLFSMVDTLKIPDGILPSMYFRSFTFCHSASLSKYSEFAALLDIQLTARSATLLQLPPLALVRSDDSAHRLARFPEAHSPGRGERGIELHITI